MTGLTLPLVLGLLFGAVLARIVARRRRARLQAELAAVERELELLGHAEVALRAFPFGEGVQQARVGLASAVRLRGLAKLRRQKLRRALGMAP